MCWAVLLVGVALFPACSSSSQKATPTPTSAPRVGTVSAVRAYTESVCGSVRGLRTVSRSLAKMIPTLRDDSVDRRALKAKIVANLTAAASASRLGAEYLRRASAAHIDGGPEHQRAVAEALTLSARGYDRWRTAISDFDVYDRDNWEDELLTLEHDDMTDSGAPAWDRVRDAVTHGPVGQAVAAAAAGNPACRSILGDQGR
jgi:hypothetical protein